MSRAPLTPGVPAPPLQVPAHIVRPEYVGKAAPTPYTGSDVQTPETIEKMRSVGALAAQCLQYAGTLVRPGITTAEIDAEAHRFLTERDAYPSPLAYRGYPRATCISLNEVICHGIPDSTVIEDGDIVNIDITAFRDGVHGDTNATFLAGDVSEVARALVEHTEEALQRAIKVCAPGRSMSVIGRVIESYARRFGYGVVRAFTGHGVHTAFHSGLVIYHYDNPDVPGVMEPGMTFTIEPMITLGGADYDQWDDGWTAVTRDGSWTAQFEHTVLITDDGAEILTLP